MHDNSRIDEDRIARFIAQVIEPAVYRARSAFATTQWRVAGEPVPFAVAARQEYVPVTVPLRWGKAWDTTWFRLRGDVPAGWAEDAAYRDRRARIEAVIDLGFTQERPGFQCEGMAYAADGTILKGVAPRGPHVPLDARPGDEVELLIEAAANPDVVTSWDFAVPQHPGGLDLDGEPLYEAKAFDIALLDTVVWELLQDARVLAGLMHELPRDAPRRHQVRAGLMRAFDAIDPDRVGESAEAAREVLRPILASPAHASAHRIVATGHAHIDSAWLWPVRETIRKCARTFSSMIVLMDQDPGFRFACSSAQQLKWMKEHYPELFARIAEKVAAGQFVPAGGMWVEPDMNLPGGESITRQFLEGKRFFLEEFGVETREAWVPDTFGYSAGLPQIIRDAGNDWFLTQKISWNQTNVMPHHTFAWEGIDGSRVLTHFPPADTYVGELSASDLAHAERTHAEHADSGVSLVPFGFGDGGGGPTREMLAAAERTRDLEGSPRVQLGTPADFFAEVERDYADRARLPVWSGELYLELHRGTYTTQQPLKRGNRRSEHLLREAELWAATATVRLGREYPAQQLRSMWQRVLLNQFHDILPGSSITWVHREAAQAYLELEAELEALIGETLSALAGVGGTALVANATPNAWDGVPALGIGVASPGEGAGASSVREDGGSWVLANAQITAIISGTGHLVSLRDGATGREAIAPGGRGNVLQLHHDRPNRWDAWDVDYFYRSTVRDLDQVESITAFDGAGTAGVVVVRRFGDSRIEQTIRVADGEASLRITSDVDWHERRKLLKLAFELDVHAAESVAETHYGHVRRPTHQNTSWDSARFETATQRWVLVGEPGYGVAIANSSMYGYDASRTSRPDGGTTTVVRQSLLRAPTFPDPESDQGRHVLETTVRPASGVAEAVLEGYRLNLPQRTILGAGPVSPLVTVSDPAVVVEAVKLADDGSGDVIVRLYESLGGRATARVTPGFAFASIIQVDLIERPVAQSAIVADADGAVVSMRPFKIVTLRIARADG
ncbi:MAG: glycoside hydrolase family 38 C-terminal domain-containing protein [Protaetiibacter sp.]